MFNIKIVLGSNNKSKKEAIELALKELNINDSEIILLEVDSHVSSKPLNEEILIGAHNRNQEVCEYCLRNNVAFDLLVSIEGGYEQVEDNYFIVTYVSITDTNGNEYIGKSQGLQISKKMYEWVKSGNSLNKVIEEILSTKNNKKSNGISGYLTNGYYYRSKFDSSAVVSAFESMLNLKKYELLDKKISTDN